MMLSSASNRNIIKIAIFLVLLCGVTLCKKSSEKSSATKGV